MSYLFNRPFWRAASVLLIAAFSLSACLGQAQTPSPEATEPSATPAPVQEQAPPPTQAPQVLPTADLSVLLVGQLWVLVAMGDVANPLVVEEGTLVTATFGEDGVLSGSGGCNQYSGAYRLDGDQLAAGPFASTMMACEVGMDQEGRYLTALEKAQRIAFTPEGRLQVFYDAIAQVDEALVFAPGAEPLVGPTWVLTAMGEAANPPAAEAGVSVTAEFSAEGGLSGSAGCNRYTTGYEITPEGGMSTGMAASTMMFCDKGMEQESAFLAALNQAQAYKISGATLEITYAGGLLRFSARSLPLEFTQWEASTFNGAPVSVNAPLTMLFTPGENPVSGMVSGLLVCNRYGSGYTTADGSLTLELPAMTSMYCGEGLQESEVQYLAFLEKAQSYVILGEQMTIRGEGGSAVFVSGDLPLEGTQWQLVALGARLEPEQPAQGAEFSALFTRQSGLPSGAVQGKAGCNSYNTTFTANQTELKFNPLAMTRMACEPEIAGQENEFTGALAQAYSYRITGDTLVIPYGEDKALVFVALAQEVEPASDLSALNGATWYLVSMNDQPALVGSQVTASFVIDAGGASGQVNGKAGCNDYSAVVAEGFAIQMPVSTRMYCTAPAGVMEQEAAYLAALPQATGFSVAGEQLIITTAAGNLIYTATPPVGTDQTSLLVGRKWFLTEINSTPVLPGEAPNATFAPQGELSGSGGCNTFSGGYNTDRDALKVGPLATTMMACAPELMSQESTYLAALENSATFLVDGLRLTIFAADGSILKFAATPPEGG